MLGCCAHGKNPSCSIFADCLWRCWLLQKHCAAFSLLYVLERRMAYSLCVVCCTGLCSHSDALQHVQSSAQPTSRCYRYKLCVISDYNYKCRPPNYNILRDFCEVEHTHAQTDDAQCQLNCSFTHDTVLK